MFFYFLKLIQSSGFIDGSKKVYETPPSLPYMFERTKQNNSMFHMIIVKTSKVIYWFSVSNLFVSIEKMYCKKSIVKSLESFDSTRRKRICFFSPTPPPSVAIVC
jgi:hypothetical protein